MTARLSLPPPLERIVAALAALDVGPMQLVITEALLRTGRGPEWAATLLASMAHDMERQS